MFQVVDAQGDPQVHAQFEASEVRQRADRLRRGLVCQLHFHCPERRIRAGQKTSKAR